MFEHEKAFANAPTFMSKRLADALKLLAKTQAPSIEEILRKRGFGYEATHFVQCSKPLRLIAYRRRAGADSQA